MPARVSADGGKTWDGDVLSRDGFRPDMFGNNDFGYPQVTVNPENLIVALSSWATR